jgi:hypothetical protein
LRCFLSRHHRRRVKRTDGDNINFFTDARPNSSCLCRTLLTVFSETVVRRLQFRDAVMFASEAFLWLLAIRQTARSLVGESFFGRPVPFSFSTLPFFEYFDRMLCTDDFGVFNRALISRTECPDSFKITI